MDTALLTISSKNEQTSIRMQNMALLFPYMQLFGSMVIRGEGAFQKLASKLMLQWGHITVSLWNSQIQSIGAATQE